MSTRAVETCAKLSFCIDCAVARRPLLVLRWVSEPGIQVWTCCAKENLNLPHHPHTPPPLLKQLYFGVVRIWET